MNKITTFSLSLIIMILTTLNSNSSSYSLVPVPSKMEPKPGVFKLSSTTQIHLQNKMESKLNLGRYLVDVIKSDAKLSLNVTNQPNNKSTNAIILKYDPANPDLGDEGYQLSIMPSTIELTGAKPAGLFYGIQTLRQIISASDGAALPCVVIQDNPQYAWRGLLLDSARHFLEVDFIKRYIDLMAYHKLNKLHLHLTDDQGWRVEIKGYPKLTEVGAYRGQGDQRYGGFYTQDQLREIVAYAASRFITVIPEFEMPGHATAAVASYPELGCVGKPIPVETKWGVFPDVYCPGKESTFKFLVTVLDQLTDIFPSEFIHIGGDEAPRTRWKTCPHCQARMTAENLKTEDELQGYLIERIAKFLSSKNRRLVGWDEILDVGGLPPSAVVHSWRGMAGAVRASKLNHDVIASPYQFVYFDYPNTPHQQKTDLKGMRVTTLETVYQFKPTPPDFSPQQAAHVLGAECTMWSERAPQHRIDMMLFPRLCAFCEVLWSPGDRRVWNDFTKRMEVHLKRLDNLNVKYYQGE